MTLRDAIRKAQSQGAVQIYRASTPWHHRGIRTKFLETEDLTANDWQVVEVDRWSIYAGWSGLQ